MKLEDLIVPGALLAGLYLMKDTIASLVGGASSQSSSSQSSSSQSSSSQSSSSQDAPPAEVVYVYPEEVYNTQIPVVPSEPDVSEGIPIPGNPAIPLCPTLVDYPRFAGDTQLCCQCPRGQLQCGEPYSMNKLMLGTAPEDIAWRERFCFLA